MSGSGRGRGWLNLKNKNTVTHTIKDNFKDTSVFDDANQTEKYSNIISRILLYDENEDILLLYLKIDQIIEEFNKVCKSEKEVKEAVDAIHEYCFKNEALIAKLIAIITEKHFQKALVLNVKLRSFFITKFQDEFEASNELQKTNPEKFRINVKMFGYYYYKGTLNGTMLQFFIKPLLKYLNMLLELNSEKDFELFTIMLNLNANNIKDVDPSMLFNLSIKIREILVHSNKLTIKSKFWLLMAIDITCCRSNSMNNEWLQYYLSQLGENALLPFKSLPHLNIQTNQRNSTLDNIQSDVNVLQKVTTDRQVTNELESLNLTVSSNSQTSTTDQGLSNIGTWEQPKNEKTPRPILGAGNRMKHTENKQNTYNKSRNLKKNDKGFADNKSNNYSHKSSNYKKYGEHDDRFENDYD